MARTPHILLVEGRFYDDIADLLAAGAVAELEAQGSSFDRVAVPGAFEIPGAIRYALDSGRYDGFVALGCVIRGETPHFDFVAAESARGLSELAIHFGAPIGYGILTTENHAQALERASVTGRNKGRDAVRACLAMVALKTRLSGGHD